MKKITLEEKIKLITAYTEDIPVEIYDKDDDDWLIKRFDVWDFEKGIYRIKSETTATTKFKVGDVLLYKGDEGFANPDRYEVLAIKEGMYELSEAVDRFQGDVEDLFVNENDVLWYFEWKDTSGNITTSRNVYLDAKVIDSLSIRLTIPEAKKLVENSKTLVACYPLCSLGFKLKEN
ncbi:hypothetical protein [Campylobacter concisus]